MRRTEETSCQGKGNAKIPFKTGISEEKLNKNKLANGIDMAKAKSEIREIVLDILFGRETTEFGASQFGNLAHGVAEVIAHRDAITQNRMSDGRGLELSSADKITL